MVGSEFGVRNMKAWIHPALSQGSGWWWWSNDIFLAHFGPLSTNWALFKPPQPTRVLLLTMSIPLWLQYTHLLIANSSRITHHITKLKSSQTGFLNMTMSSLYSNGLHSHQISIQEHLWDVVEREIHGCAADKSAATAWCYHVNMDQNLWGMFPTPCWIYATKN